VYARVVTNQIQPGRIDEWPALIRDSIVPSLQEHDGFKGFVALMDRERGKTVGHSMWERGGAGRERVQWPLPAADHQARRGAGLASGPGGGRADGGGPA
jgi:hypothetical protein